MYTGEKSLGRPGNEELRVAYSPFGVDVEISNSRESDHINLRSAYLLRGMHAYTKFEIPKPKKSHRLLS